MAHIQKIQEPPCLSTYSKRGSARHQRRRSWTRRRYKRLVWCICVLNVVKFFSSLYRGKKRWCKSPPSGLKATEMALVSELILFVFGFEYGRSKAPFFGRACLFPIFINTCTPKRYHKYIILGSAWETISLSLLPRRKQNTGVVASYKFVFKVTGLIVNFDS